MRNAVSATVVSHDVDRDVTVRVEVAIGLDDRTLVLKSVVNPAPKGVPAGELVYCPIDAADDLADLIRSMGSIARNAGRKR